MSDPIVSFKRTNYCSLASNTTPDLLNERISYLEESKKAPFKTTYVKINVNQWLENRKEQLKDNNSSIENVNYYRIENLAGIGTEITKAIYHLAKMILIDPFLYVFTKTYEKSITYDAYMSLSCLEASFGHLIAIFSQKGNFKIEKAIFDKEVHAHLLEKWKEICAGPESKEHKKIRVDAENIKLIAPAAEETPPREYLADSAPLPKIYKPFEMSEKDFSQMIQDLQLNSTENPEETESYKTAIAMLTQFDDEEALRKTLEAGKKDVLGKSPGQSDKIVFAKDSYKHPISLAWLSYLYKMHSYIVSKTTEDSSEDAETLATEYLKAHSPNDTLIENLFIYPNCIKGIHKDILPKTFLKAFTNYRQFTLYWMLDSGSRGIFDSLYKSPKLHVEAKKQDEEAYLHHLKKACEQNLLYVKGKQITFKQSLDSTATFSDRDQFCFDIINIIETLGEYESIEVSHETPPNISAQETSQSLEVTHDTSISDEMNSSKDFMTNILPKEEAEELARV